MAVALLGAGFSRSWGGWLAQEVIGELLGRIGGHQELYWRLRKTADFELVLAEARERALVRGTPDAIEPLRVLETAIIEVFSEMNRSFCTLEGLDFIEDPAFSATTFLGALEEIYTLNQDLLLETHYVPTPGLRTWQGPAFPGVVAPDGWAERDRWERTLEAWTPDDTFALYRGRQPIFKLHGSVNWRERSGERLLVMGASKDQAIGRSNLLKHYFDHFVGSLMRGDQRLLVIGYSFRDSHINEVLVRASREARLQVYIVDPAGLDVLERDKRATIRAPNELDDLRIAGMSRRTLDAIFRGSDSLQLESLMRFVAP
jgi:hypothetical protein